MGGLTALVDWGRSVNADAFLEVAECDSHRGAAVTWCDPNVAVVARSWGWEESALWVSDGIVGAVHGFIEGSSPVPSAEYLVDGFRRSGMDFLVGLEGEHSFILWEAAARRLYLSRGIFGVKPLFYRRAGSALAISTGVEALLRWANEPSRLSFSRLSADLGYPPGGAVAVPAPSQTVFAGIFRVLPGQVEVFQSIEPQAGVRIWEFPRRIDRSHSLESAGLDMRGRLRDAMARRPWHRPLISMSGGMDSTALAAVASREQTVRQKFSRGGSVHAVTIVGSGELGLERARAKTVADALGLAHHELDGDTMGALEALRRLAVECDQPYFLGGGLVFKILEFARERGFTEIVLGHGGDEFWRYRRLPRYRHLRAVGRQVLGIARRIVDGTPQVAVHRGANGAAHESAVLQKRKEFLENLLAGPAFENLEQLFARYGVNASFPYYDSRLASLAFSIRPELHGFDGMSKAVPKRAMRGFLPDSFLESWAPISHNGGWLRAVRKDENEFPVDFQLSAAGNSSDDGLALGFLLDRHCRLATIVEWLARSRLSPSSVWRASGVTPLRPDRGPQVGGQSDD